MVFPSFYVHAVLSGMHVTRLRFELLVDMSKENKILNNTHIKNNIIKLCRTVLVIMYKTVPKHVKTVVVNR